MRPSSNSLIAKKPVFYFLLVNASVVLAEIVVYISGTPLRIVLLTSIFTLAIMNAILLIMRRRIPPATQAGTGATEAAPSRKRAWLWLILGLFMLVDSSYQIAYPNLPSDRPLGFMILIGSPALLFMAWKEFRKRSA
jgi:hypothetical protein